MTDPQQMIFVTPHMTRTFVAQYSIAPWELEYMADAPIERTRRRGKKMCWRTEGNLRQQKAKIQHNSALRANADYLQELEDQHLLEQASKSIHQSGESNEQQQ